MSQIESTTKIASSNTTKSAFKTIAFPTDKAFKRMQQQQQQQWKSKHLVEMWFIQLKLRRVQQWLQNSNWATEGEIRR